MSTISFKDSQEAAFRRFVSDAIKRGPFTKSERDVTLAVVNHWFHHKGGAKPFIHPSREAIAKKAKVSVRTVASVFAMLRAAWVMIPLSSLKGGKAKATQYQVDTTALLVLCGCDWVDDFLRGTRQNCTVSIGIFARYARAKIAHCLNDVRKDLSQDGETDE